MTSLFFQKTPSNKSVESELEEENNGSGRAITQLLLVECYVAEVKGATRDTHNLEQRSGFKFQLHSQFELSAGVHCWKPQIMAQTVGSLSSPWETQTELPALGFSLARS